MHVPARFVLGPLVLATVALTGCVGHGGYTKAHLSAAKEKMDMMKSATEWEMARQAFLAGDLEKALRGVNQSLTINPNVAKSHLLKGRVLLEMNDLEGSLACFERSHELQPDNAEAEYYHALAFERFAKPDEALAHYLKACELDVSSAQYCIATAETMIDLNRMDEAEKFLTERRVRHEHNAGVRQTLGHIALMRGDSAHAVELFNEARLLAPDDKGILEDLTSAQIQLGRYADAEANLARLLTGVAPTDRRDLRHQRANCLKQLNRPLEAREVLVQLTEGAAGQADTDAWIALGRVAYELKDNARLRAAAARVVANEPKMPDGYILKALLERRQGNLRAARDYAAQALMLRRDSSTLVLLGMICKESGETDTARLCFQEATKLDPSDKSASSMLASMDASSASATR
jgi:tetratricopeptide (TPR) repeat protein